MQFMRKRFPNKPVLLAVNKCESPVQGLTQAAAFWGYGHEPIAISALNGTGCAAANLHLSTSPPHPQHSVDT
eukprot:741041-Pyramimonas_sp.AAC.1